MNAQSAVPCREVFDENSQPSAEEISEYAQQLGIDPESESHLLPLARDGLMQALPPPWKAFYDEKIQLHYYYNNETKKTQWEHPLDNVYRELVRKARDTSIHDDTYVSVQELLTSEENTKHLERVETKVESDDEDLSTDNESSAKDNTPANILPGRRLAPLGRPPLSPIIRPLDKKLSDLRVSPLRRSVDSSISFKPNLSRNTQDKDMGRILERPKLFKQQSEIIDLKIHVLNSPEEENFDLLAGVKSERPVKGLPLTGKGSVFLKNKKTDLPSPDTEKSLPLDSMTKSDPPKGILREKLVDNLHRKVESLSLGKPRQTTSFDDDRKSVRFKLENTVEPTISPGSNSSSDFNDGQSSIISATPTNPPNFKINETLPSTPSTVPTSVPNILFNKPSLANIVLSPIVTRPPLPPRPQSSLEQIVSPRELSKSVSGSDNISVESESREISGTSPKRRVIKPPATDYIRQDLFQKNFQKISDLVKPGDIEPSSNHLEEPKFEKECRPRSPMIPPVNKISINLMESIESETSIDSPDKEFANLDLNEMNDTKNDYVDSKLLIKNTDSQDSLVKESKLDPKIKQNNDVSDEISLHSSKIDNHKKPSDVFTSQKIFSKLDAGTKLKYKESEDSKRNSANAESKGYLRSVSLDINKHVESKISTPVIKSINNNVSLDIHSPKSDLGDRPSWSSLSKLKTNFNKTPQVKSSDSTTSLSKGLTSPRLDGVVISQEKSLNHGSDNVVVMYQFEENDDNSFSKTIKSSNELARDMLERNKVEERKRLELSLQKEIEELRVEWVTKERRMRAELQEELRVNEEKFREEKRRKLQEQLEKHQREMEESLEESQRNHEMNLQAAQHEIEKRYQSETEVLERKLKEDMAKLREEHSRKLNEQRKELELENDRAISELRDHLQQNLTRERGRILEDNRITVESLREEQNSRVTELRQDYRAEVERLRNQHACHLEELRARLSSERAAAMRRGTNDQVLADKYKCLKEKYARLKHDVKMSIERRNKRREMSMTTGSETEKSNSHKANPSLERCKEVNETSVSVVLEPDSSRPRNNNPAIKYKDNETSLSESNAQKSLDNNNDDWKGKKADISIISPVSSASQPCGVKMRRTTVAFKEPLRRHNKDKSKDAGAATDYQDSSDATTADEKPKDSVSNGHTTTRRRCFTRLKSASTSRLNYSPKRSEGWSSPLEALRQQLRKLDDLEDQFPDLACQPNYSLRYPFTELGCVTEADTAELEFVRHRALVEREGIRRARAALRRRRAETRLQRTPHDEERETTELEVALHRARALLGEKEIRLRHIERSLQRMAENHQTGIVQLVQEATASDASSGSELEVGGSGSEAVAPGAVLRSLRALHADVRDIWRALDARRPFTASPETSSCHAGTASQPRMSLSVQESPKLETEGSVAERARGLRAWLQTTP